MCLVLSYTVNIFMAHQFILNRTILVECVEFSCETAKWKQGNSRDLTGFKCADIVQTELYISE